MIFNLFFNKEQFQNLELFKPCSFDPVGAVFKDKTFGGDWSWIEPGNQKEPKVKSLNIESTLFLTFSSYNFLTNQTLQPRVSFILSLVEIRWLNVTAHSHKRFGFHKPYSKFFCKVSNQYSGESSPNEP